MENLVVNLSMNVEERKKRINELNSLIRVYRLKDEELEFAIRECNDFNRKCRLVRNHAKLIQKMNRYQLEKFLLEKQF